MLGRALAMEWMSPVIFLEAVICVTGNISVSLIQLTSECKAPEASLGKKDCYIPDPMILTLRNIHAMCNL